MLACAAETGREPLALARTWVKTTSVVKPDPKRATIYNERFEQYRQVYPIMRDFYHRTAGKELSQ